MRYVALLRGINVGGKNIIKMADLREAVEKCGFTKVSTYIQSGNIIFESNEKTTSEIIAKLEASFLKHFAYNSRIIVKNHEQLKEIAAEVPTDWEKYSDLQCYVAFLGGTVSAQHISREIELKDGIDYIKAGNGVLYMSTLLSGLTKSKFTKLITIKAYNEITIRNYNTTCKLLSLLDEP
ncbi:MAG: DUF1697 domain-containing protein [Dehalococcoidales bacterium]|nr:DUF1697 domain-containing protein [Dehalococcoidales bacterium]